MLLAFLCKPLLSLAEDAVPTITDLSTKLDAHARAIDMVWVLVTAFLVFWMQAGFAYVEGGFTQAKNTNNIMMKNLLDFCFGSIAYWAIGFGLMFGTGNDFIGTTGFFLAGDPIKSFEPIAWANVSIYAKYMFQLVFAATSATIVSGAMAERTKFSAYLWYSIFISLIIYPIFGHWVWGAGWLAKMGMWDFAGSTVVHSVGGWVALAGSIMLGPRIGKYNKDGSVNVILGHNLPMATLGVFILWLGWFGFNPGSTMSGTVDNIAHIAVTTNLAAAAGVITALLFSKRMFGRWDIGMSLNGALAGLVAITAPCAYVSPLSSVIIGGAAGIVVVLGVLLLDKLHIDDPVGAIPVHGMCGAFGTLCLGLFAQDMFMPNTTGNGLLFGGGTKLLIAQATGVVTCFVWAFGMGLILFGALKMMGNLRVSPEEELEGLDVEEHGTHAYHLPRSSIEV
ncbi:MAG: ammonium transporter [Nitrospinae bacterium]|nr:ammonium transporter [Nitrospinota bacterium]